MGYTPIRIESHIQVEPGVHAFTVKDPDHLIPLSSIYYKYATWSRNERAAHAGDPQYIAEQALRDALWSAYQLLEATLRESRGQQDLVSGFTIKGFREGRPYLGQAGDLLSLTRSTPVVGLDGCVSSWEDSYYHRGMRLEAASRAVGEFEWLQWLKNLPEETPETWAPSRPWVLNFFGAKPREYNHPSSPNPAHADEYRFIIRRHSPENASLIDENLRRIQNCG